MGKRGMHETRGWDKGGMRVWECCFHEFEVRG